MIQHFANAEFPRVTGTLEVINAAFRMLPQITNPIRARLSMDSLYDVMMGFVTPAELKARPLSTVRLFDAERQTQDMGMEKRLRMFAKANIGKHFNCAPETFLRYPTQMVEMMYRISQELNKAEQGVVEAANLRWDQIAKGFAAQSPGQNQNPPGHGTPGG